MFIAFLATKSPALNLMIELRKKKSIPNLIAFWSLGSSTPPFWTLWAAYNSSQRGKEAARPTQP